jgi:hypothetical protein
VDIRGTGYQDVDVRISEYQVAGYQGKRDLPEADECSWNREKKYPRTNPVSAGQADTFNYPKRKNVPDTFNSPQL